MKRELQRLMPLDGLIGILAALYIAIPGFVAIGFVSGTGWQNAIDVFGSFIAIQEWRAMISLMCAFAYGAYRVHVFHPICRGDYWEWLCNTPWTARLPLPVGPIHLVWQDLLVLVPLTIYGAGEQPLWLLASPLAFLGAYGLYLTFTLFATGEKWIAYAVTALGAAAMHLVFGLVFQRSYIWPLLIISAFAYALLWWGLRRSLARFDDWDGSGAATLPTWLLVLLGQRTSRFGWPYHALPLHKKTRRRTLLDEIVVSGLFGLWAWAIQVHEFIFLSLSELLFYGAPALVAWIYMFNHRPPISLFGRLATGRLIIPGYDRCLFWPVLTIALQWLLLNTARDYQWPISIAGAVQLTIVVWCVLRAVACLEAFHLTGSHRLTLPFGIAIRKEAYTTT